MIFKIIIKAWHTPFNIQMKLKTEMKKFTSTIGSIILLIPLTIQAQNLDVMPDVDVESWSGAEFKYKLNRNWIFSVKQQLRFKSNISTYDRVFNELKTEFRFLKSMETGIGYRYIFLNDIEGGDRGTERHSRIHFYYAYKFTILRLSIKNRIRYQSRKEVFDKPSLCRRNTLNYWRLRSTLSYNIKNWKLDPVVSYEVFFRGFKYHRGQHNKYRYILGTEYKINKNQKLGFRYMYERELKGWNPEVIHIFDIQYTYTLKRKK